MNWVRNFSNQEGHIPPHRNVEDAPRPLRQELIDFFYHVSDEMGGGVVPPDRLSYIVIESLGFQVAERQYQRRQQAGACMAEVEWPRVYDVIVRLVVEFQRNGFFPYYQTGINRILAAHGAAWDLGEDGRLQRVLPAAAQAQVSAAFAELNDPRYAAALALFNTARDAYDERPRRDRDACANIFDALESVVRVKYNRPTETFGQIKNHLEQNNLFRPELIAIFTALNQMRNQFFGHGAPFPLSAAEVDFIYLTCIGAVLLFARTL